MVQNNESREEAADFRQEARTLKMGVWITFAAAGGGGIRAAYEFSQGQDISGDLIALGGIVTVGLLTLGLCRRANNIAAALDENSNPNATRQQR